jgi:hypothetical protein
LPLTKQKKKKKEKKRKEVRELKCGQKPVLWNWAGTKTNQNHSKQAASDRISDSKKKSLGLMRRQRDCDRESKENSAFKRGKRRMKAHTQVIHEDFPRKFAGELEEIVHHVLQMKRLS